MLDLYRTRTIWPWQLFLLACAAALPRQAAAQLSSAQIGAAYNVPGSLVGHDAARPRCIFPRQLSPDLLQAGVVNGQGELWVQELSSDLSQGNGTVGSATRIPGTIISKVPVACVWLTQNRLAVVDKTDGVTVYEVSKTVGPAKEVKGPALGQGSPVQAIFPFANPNGPSDEIGVVNGKGELWVHRIGSKDRTARRIPGVAMAQAPAGPAKYVLSPDEQDILLINQQGEVWGYVIAAGTKQLTKPVHIPGPPVAKDPKPPLAVFMFVRKIVIDNADGEIWVQEIGSK